MLTTQYLVAKEEKKVFIYKMQMLDIYYMKFVIYWFNTTRENILSIHNKDFLRKSCTEKFHS